MTIARASNWQRFVQGIRETGHPNKMRQSTVPTWPPIGATLSRPLIIAHRGASASAPENTMAAFYTAQEQGADAFETDIVLTRDGRPVCLHDAFLAGNALEPVRHLTHRTFTALFPCAPTLAEAIAIPMPIYLDIKETAMADVVSIIASCERDHDLSRFLVGVHSAPAASELQARFPRLHQVALMDAASEIDQFCQTLTGHWVRLRSPAADSTVISSLKSRSMRVMVTCVDGGIVGQAGAGEIARLVEAHVDALVVNDPAFVASISCSDAACPTMREVVRQVVSS
jgi:glycerophosphoryl diester phosphodiesterase